MDKLSSSDRARLRKDHASSFVDWLHVIKASGPRIRDYLQGQITQDIAPVSEDQGIYAAALTPQGKLVCDMHLLEGHGDELVLVAESSRASSLVGRLRQFSLGFEVRIGIVEQLGVIALQGMKTDPAMEDAGLPVPNQTLFATTRVEGRDTYVMRVPMAASDGIWLVTAKGEKTSWLENLGSRMDEDALQAARILNGYPRFGIDFDESCYPLNVNFIERQGVCFDKGCYVGQELTSRMRWRGRIKHRLYRVQMNAAPSILPAIIKTSAPMGRITSLAEAPGGDYAGIAQLRIEAVTGGAPLFTDNNIPIEIVDEVH